MCWDILCHSLGYSLLFLFLISVQERVDIKDQKPLFVPLLPFSTVFFGKTDEKETGSVKTSA